MILMNSQCLDQLTLRTRRPLTEPSEGLLGRLRLLDAKDRLLMEMALKHRLSCRQMATVLGQQAGTVHRRFRRLFNRLHDPLIVWLADPRCPLSPDDRQIGIDYFLNRRSVATLAEQYRRSAQEVRGLLQYIRGWHQGMKAQPAGIRFNHVSRTP